METLKMTLENMNAGWMEQYGHTLGGKDDVRAEQAFNAIERVVMGLSQEFPDPTAITIQELAEYVMNNLSKELDGETLGKIGEALSKATNVMEIP
jgi:hypothetical protein